MNRGADERAAMARLWLEAEPAVRAYVFVAVQNFQDAEDVVQQTALTAARRFEEYDAIRPFAAWVLWLAKSRVIDHYRKQGRQRVVFSETLLDGIAEALVEWQSPRASAHAAALERCLEKLPPKSRRLLDLRYTDDASMDAIAGAIGSTAGAVRVMLFRIRNLLAECVRGELATDERP
jgi:RNA polymerase sigma-70 factor (ECF subfamily)